MNPSWDEVPLGDLFSVKHGFAFKGKYFTDQPQESILVTPGNFAVGGGFQDSKRKYYLGPIPDDYVLHPGQIIVTMTDLSKQADTLGYAAKVPSDSNVWLHNQRIGLLIFNKDKNVNPDFILYLLRSSAYRAWIIGSATGSTVKHTSPKRIEKYRTFIPSLLEQNYIANILKSLDDKIALNRRQNETLEAMAQAIFKDWFVDFGPVRAKMEGRDAYLPKEIWQLFPDSLDEEGKPEGWLISTIGDEVSIYGGSTPSTKNPDFWEDGHNYWATPKDLSSLQSSVLLETARKITDKGVTKISSGQLPVGSVLLSSRAPIGYMAINEIPTSINQGFIGMTCDKSLPNLFVLFWCKQYMGLITGNANGSTFQEISKKNFRPIPVCVPESGILDAFMAQVGPMYTHIATNEKEMRTLSKLRDTLLPKLISGELRIPDAEQVIEESI